MAASNKQNKSAHGSSYPDDKGRPPSRFVTNAVAACTDSDASNKALLLDTIFMTKKKEHQKEEWTDSQKIDFVPLKNEQHRVRSDDAYYDDLKGTDGSFVSALLAEIGQMIDDDACIDAETKQTTT